MQYRYIKKDQNYEDYSSGRVLVGYSGATNFPVRLTREIFETCIDYLKKENNHGPYTIYDPLCGVGYTLTILGLFYGENIKKIFASDINEESIGFANKNLSLLISSRLDTRIKEIKSLFDLYKKQSHKDALESALKIRGQLQKNNIKIEVFKHDIFSSKEIELKNIDIIISDIPYGNLVTWNEKNDSDNPTQKFLDSVKSILSNNGIVAISSNKTQDLAYNGYTKVSSFKIGKRKVIFLKPTE